MCVPTERATAPTLSKDMHLRLAHTLNVRLLPSVGGPLSAAEGTAVSVPRTTAGSLFLPSCCTRRSTPGFRKWCPSSNQIANSRLTLLVPCDRYRGGRD